MKRASEADLLDIGRYELFFELATGGMGRVFVARQLGDAGFERLVALKRVHPHLVSDPEVYAMASDEARLSALLHHPNIVPVIDVVDAKGELVLVMEYVEGVSLASLLRARTSSSDADARASDPLALPLVSRIALDALRGLAAAHDARDLNGEPLELVHRDVSPQNLLVGVDGTTRLIDFGIARAEGRLALTKTGVIKGKVVYMAPERLEEKAVDRRADLFAVGAVLYELVCGSWAFGAGDEAAQMSRILLGDIDFALVRERAPSLAPVIERALARRPADRFDSAAEMARAVALAIPPAEPGEVREVLLAAKGRELDTRRERIAKAISERLAAEPDPIEASSADEVAAPAKAARATSEPPRPRRSAPWVVALGLGALVVNAVGWYSLTRRDVVSTPVDKSASVVTTSGPSTKPLETAVTQPSSVAAAASAAIPPGSTTGAPVSASALPRAGGLEASPYNGDLRKSPYKRP